MFVRGTPLPLRDKNGRPRYNSRIVPSGKATGKPIPPRSRLRQNAGEQRPAFWRMRLRGDSGEGGYGEILAKAATGRSFPAVRPRASSSPAPPHRAGVAQPGTGTGRTAPCRHKRATHSPGQHCTPPRWPAGLAASACMTRAETESDRRKPCAAGSVLPAWQKLLSLNDLRLS